MMGKALRMHTNKQCKMGTQQAWEQAQSRRPDFLLFLLFFLSSPVSFPLLLQFSRRVATLLQSQLKGIQKAQRVHNGDWMTYSLFLVPPCVITLLLSQWRPRRGHVGESRLQLGG